MTATVRFVTSRHDGMSCWYYVSVREGMLDSLDRASAEPGFDPRPFGIILESALGDHPPQNVIDFMREHHGITTPEASTNQSW